MIKKWFALIPMFSLSLIACKPVSGQLIRAKYPYSEAIKNFEFQGLKFGTDFKTFQKLFPSMIYLSNQSDSKINLNVYSLHGILGIDEVQVWFLDSIFYQATYFYKPETTNKLGGWMVIPEKIVSKYGKANRHSKDTDVKTKDEIAEWYWEFDDVNRYIDVIVKTDVEYARFIDEVLYNKATDRRNKLANVGF